MNPFLNIALAFLGSLITKAANVVWDDLWAKLFELIAKAEEIYFNNPGETKRQWVIDETMKWFQEVLKPGPLQVYILKLALGILVDGLVKTLNDALGHNWVAKAKEIEQYLASILPVIK